MNKISFKKIECNKNHVVILVKIILKKHVLSENISQIK